MKKILIIGYVWPEPNSTAAGGRMLQLIQFFLQQEYQITFASTATETEFTQDLTVLGVNKVTIRLNHSSFDEFIKELHPEIVLFDRFMVEEQFGWRVAKHVPNALLVLDTEDLHSLRTTRQKSFTSGTPFSLDKWLQSDIAKREMASIYRCDFSLIVSSYEMELLQKVIKMDENLLLHLPFLLDKIKEDDFKEWSPFGKRKDFVCIGNGKHAPNIDALHWLKKEIWPLIHQQLPEAKVLVYGAYLPEYIRQMHCPQEGFYIMGRAEDVKEIMGKARITLAPLRFGAGIKGKLTDAMLCGTPSITTAIGAEGMHKNLPWNGSIEDKPEKIAHAAVELYKDRAKWEKAQQNGIAIINQLYDKNVLSHRMMSKIKDVHNHRIPYRAQNFIGSMLRHHTMASTKYMSRWIEAKNAPTDPTPEGGEH